MKVRIRKPLEGGKHLKKGIITIEDEKGTYYRIACEGCDLSLKLNKPPLEGETVLCKDCQLVADWGKPGTHILRHRSSFDYETPCDHCGSLERTSFLPKRERPFLCNQCLKLKRSGKLLEQEDLAGDQGREKRNQNQASESSGRNQSTDDVRKNYTIDGSDRQPEPAGQSVEAGSGHDMLEKAKNAATFQVKCSKCRTVVHLKFKPSSRKPFICPSCYEARQKELRGEKPDTKVLYNIECSQCGKNETLNFIPTYPERALCESCFEQMKRRKK